MKNAGGYNGARGRYDKKSDTLLVPVQRSVQTPRKLFDIYPRCSLLSIATSLLRDTISILRKRADRTNTRKFNFRLSVQ
jgi:hypothetical protein